MGIARFIGAGQATHAWTEALGGFSVIHGFDFTEPYPKHVHARLIVGALESGSFRISAGGHTYDQPVDAVIAINSFRVHREEWNHGCFRALYFSPENLVAAGLCLPNATEPWFEDPVVHDQALALQVREVHDAVEHGLPVPVIEAMTTKLLRDLCASPAAGVEEPLPAPVAAARERIHANLAAPPTMFDLGAAVQRSPYHLIRLFKREIGLPPHAYFDQVRIALAKERLKQGQKLSLTAYELGFCDQSHFTRAFKRSSLVTPGRYLQMVLDGPGAGRNGQRSVTEARVGPT
jgi:AraC-like DNA-binding protein